MQHPKSFEAIYARLQRDPQFTREFALIAHAGSGGFGHVVKAQIRTNGNPSLVAIKCFDLENEQPAGNGARNWNMAWKKMLHEAKGWIRAAEGNPWIAKFLGIRTLPLPMLIVEWAGEDTARSWTRDALVGKAIALDADLYREQVLRALEVGIQVGTGLDIAHGRGLYHLDVKPDNILIQEATDSPRVHCKLIDFGVSRAAQATNRSLEIPGYTPGYADHACYQEKGDARSDIYALGWTLIQIATFKQAKSLFHSPETRLGALDQCGIGENCKDLLARATDADPTERPTAAELVEGFKTAFEEASGGAWIPPSREAAPMPLADPEKVQRYIDLAQHIESITSDFVQDRHELGEKLRFLADLYPMKMQFADAVDFEGYTRTLGSQFLFLAVVAGTLHAWRDDRPGRALFYGTISEATRAFGHADARRAWRREAVLHAAEELQSCRDVDATIRRIEHWRAALVSVLECAAPRRNERPPESLVWLLQVLQRPSGVPLHPYSFQDVDRKIHLTAMALILAAVAVSRNGDRDGIFETTRALLSSMNLWSPWALKRAASNRLVEDDSSLLSTHAQMELIQTQMLL